MKFSRSDFEMQRFESRRPSQRVQLQRVSYEDRLKNALYRGISQIGAGLRVRNSAMEAYFGPLSPRAIFGVSFYGDGTSDTREAPVGLAVPRRGTSQSKYRL
jgi:hypothetical protein